MTLVLIWRNGNEMTVIADTLFRARGASALEVGPKIFISPITARTFGADLETRQFPPVGFAFAGHTAAGQTTHAIASAGLQDLMAANLTAIPSLLSVANYYARCAAEVVNEMRRFHAIDAYLLEGVVFGWEEGLAKAFSFEVVIDDEAQATANSKELDWEAFGLYAIGQGFQEIREFIQSREESASPPTVFEALEAVIADDNVPSVGAGIQAATVGPDGARLRSVMWVNARGEARGGYMGTDSARLGVVDGYIPSMSAVMLDVTANKHVRTHHS